MNRCPVYLNVRDRLTTTRKLAEQCAKLPGAEVIIIDEASTHPPLLEWYCDCPYQIVRFDKNHGPRGAWLGMLDHAAQGITRYVVTDSDLDLDGVPGDVLELLAAGLERYPWAVKAGLSLEIDDLPAGYPHRETVISRESVFWNDRLDFEFFKADIDTTFAMYRTEGPQGVYGPALRTDRPYTARHVPWYTEAGKETAEDVYYWRHLNPYGIFWSALANEPYRLDCYK